jgi:hypothetical protein
MPYKTILNFLTVSKGPQNSIVKFIVKDEELGKENIYTVSAEIPNDALKYHMIRIGADIRWEDANVYIEIEGVEDVMFKKVYTQRKNQTSFVKT